MKYVLTAAMIAASGLVQAAETIDCGEVDLKTVYVQADRGDGSFHANKMLILMGRGRMPLAMILRLPIWKIMMTLMTVRYRWRFRLIWQAKSSGLLLKMRQLRLMRKGLPG
ncbi:hypothetical protein KDD30_01750 [Photobacterium sp. GJ3]|uniref:hypothetical protein n=1 Tax=Photobacterium sp. GJ3 TaxID=2829502 RepID=UPI001B8C83DB|nr:hypothetical protein [Photobacterium sp. GJ3]QUJ67910.1 hypothetical protein KDD30_01750 [Photobacterium sp. GJ3]